MPLTSFETVFVSTLCRDRDRDRDRFKLCRGVAKYLAHQPERASELDVLKVQAGTFSGELESNV